MKYIILNDIPQIKFAHRYSTNKYNLEPPFSKTLIEFTYHSKGESYLKEADNIIYVPENSIVCLMHNKKRQAYSSCLQEHYTICIEVNYEIAHKPSKFSFPFFDQITDPEIVMKIAKKIQHIIHQKQSNTLDSFQESSEIFELLSMYCKYEKAKKLAIENINLAYKIIHYVNKAKKYISSNINRQIKVEEIANYLKISCGYLSKIFKEGTGESIITYINKLKLSIILELVYNKKCSLYDACEQLSLNDPNYVSHMYKKYYGKKFSELLKKD